MFYVASKYSSDSLERRGGTEKIVELLVKRFQYQPVNLTQAALPKRGLFFFVGLPLLSQIRYALLLRGRAYIVKTATYSKKRAQFERCIWWLLSFVSNVVVITRSQKQTYARALHLDLFYLYGIADIELEGDLSVDEKRPFEYGYVGRVDRKKGYYTALSYLRRLSVDHVCCLDVLLWNDSDKQQVPAAEKNLKVILGNRTKSEPCFDSIKSLLLPYEDLSTTIAFPLVVLEACLKGCMVYTTSEVLELAHFEFPQLSSRVRDIRELDDVK